VSQFFKRKGIIETISMDLNLEAHDTHHPIAWSLYYDDQKDESLRRSHEFRAARIPKFLEHFSSQLEANPDNGELHLVGNKMTTADLALFHVLCGIEHAFPKRMATMRRNQRYDNVFKFVKQVAASENIATYLVSERRTPFGMGIFRSVVSLGNPTITHCSLGIIRSLMASESSPEKRKRSTKVSGKSTKTISRCSL
jgi:Glutathione S-transferase, C-terminal domain